MNDLPDRPDALVRWAMDAEAPADVEDRLRRRFSEFQRKVGQRRSRVRYWLPGGAAAMLLVALALRAWLPGGVSWAQVQESVGRVPWVHYVQRDSETNQVLSETWVQTAPPRRFIRSEQESPRTVLVDYLAREKWMYWPDTRTVTIHRLQDDGEAPANPFLDVLDPGKRPAWVHSVKRAGAIGGLIRFDVLHAGSDERQEPWLAVQVWVDEVSGLPARAELLSEAGKPTSEYTVDYPGTGPADVFAAGVPGDVTIQDARPAADVQDLMATYESYREAFPERYRAVMAADWFPQASRVVSRDGRKTRVETYFNPVERATPDVLEAWKQLLFEGHVPPATVSACDGTRTAVWRLDKEKEVHRGTARGLLVEPGPERIGWPEMPQMPVRRITSEDPALDGMFGLQFMAVATQERRDEYWLNPARDYLVHRFVWKVREGDRWRIQRREEVLEYARLRSGHWYPRLKEVAGQQYDFLIHMDIQENPEFAEGAFDMDATPPWGSAIVDVVDPEGRPVEGVEVLGLEPWWLGRARVEDAQVVLPYLQPDRPQEFLLTHRDRGLVGRAVVTPGRGTEVRHRVTLKQGVSLSGFARDAERNPVAGAQARLLVRSLSDLPIPLGMICGGTETGPNGRYELTALHPDLEYAIQPWKAGFAASQCKVEMLEASGLARAEEAVFMPATALLAGRVTTKATGRPIEGMDVVLRMQTPAPGSEPLLWHPKAFGQARVVQTDALGAWRADRLQSGAAYLVYVRDPQYERSSYQAVRPGREDVDFVLTAAGSGDPAARPK